MGPLVMAKKTADKPRVRKVGDKFYNVDGLRSFTSGMGTMAHDKSASSHYYHEYLSPIELEAAYRSSWIAKKIVDVPAQDALRKWRDWKGDSEQIKQLINYERKMNVRGKVLDAYKYGRLWGGGAIVIGTDQTDKEEPLDPSKVGRDGIKYLTVVSRHELNSEELNYDVLDPNYGRPEFYTVANSKTYTRIHHSHLVLFRGNERPDLWGYISAIERDYFGWGDSVLQATYDSIKNADSTCSNIASLVFEANVDVYGIEDLTSLLDDPEYEKRIIDRFALANVNKSVNRALIHDQSEVYDRKQIAFTTLPEVIQQFVLLAAGAADIPLTRFLGQSPSGMSATGEGDMKNYYDSVSSRQELEIEPALMILDECLIRSALGSRPEDLTYEWRPLEQMSEKDIADIGKTTAETAKILFDTNLINPEILHDGLVNQLVETGAFPGIDADHGEFDFGAEMGNEQE